MDAVLPAIAIEPKELIDDWINTLDNEKTTPCMPAGKPICIFFIFSFEAIQAECSAQKAAQTMSCSSIIAPSITNFKISGLYFILNHYFQHYFILFIFLLTS